MSTSTVKISRVRIAGFRGLSVDVSLKRVNIVVGENGTGKTSFLEAIFLSSLFQSTLSDHDLFPYIDYVFKSRGDFISALSTISDSEVVLDDTVTRFKWVDLNTLKIYVANEEVARIIVKVMPSVVSIPLTTALSFRIMYAKRKVKKYTPLYISTYFEAQGIPERIYSISRREGGTKVKTELEILQDPYGKYKLYYNGRPAYVMGRGLLKRELIRLALLSSNLLLIDEIEDSLHPDLVMQVLNDIKREESTQAIFTTHVNEVVKLAGKVFDDSEAQVIYFSKTGHRVYKLSEISEFEKPLSWLGYV